MAKRAKRKIYIELLAIICLAMVSHIIYGQMDLAEKYTAYSATVETYEVDELVFTVLTFSILSIVFAFRRWRELMQSFQIQSALKSELEDVNRELRIVLDDNIALVKQISISQEEERHHLIMEMHDVFGQHLAAIDANISAATDQSQQDEKLSRQLSSALTSSRHLSMLISRKLRDLRPPNLNLLSLHDALSQLVNEWQESHKEVEVQMQTSIGTHDYHESLKHAVYRIVQEALNNIAKHAKAETVDINLKTNNKAESVVLVISDDGLGIDRNNTAKGGIGLAGMKYRCEALKGKFQYRSNGIKGTKVIVELPIRSAIVEQK